MKVTTDGCLFGSVVANEIKGSGSCRVLDVGAGTGLLSLLVAQVNEQATLDAIEIAPEAAHQANENVAASPWSNRISVFQGDILEYRSPVLYPVVISNPPFYEQQLASPNIARQLAHHSSQLTLQWLFQQVQRLLTATGKFYVLLPFYRTEEAIAIAKINGLWVENQWLVKQTPKHRFFRVIFCFGRKETESVAPAEITIRTEAGEYTPTFSELLSPFYLHL